MSSLSYDVQVGDVKAAVELSDKQYARGFAKGARFVLDALNQDYENVQVWVHTVKWYTHDEGETIESERIWY